jgi:hypothetical protein
MTGDDYVDLLPQQHHEHGTSRAQTSADQDANQERQRNHAETCSGSSDTT